MSKVVSLTVHRNTRNQRRRQQTRKTLFRAAKELTEDRDKIGYALVCWDANHSFNASWDTGDMPGFAVPDFVKNALMHKMQQATCPPDQVDDPEPDPAS